MKKHIWIAAAIAAAVIAVFLSAKGGKDVSVPFSNPVIAEDCPDPTIWEENGTFYLMSTGARRIMCSKDLVTWEVAADRAIDEQSWDAAKELGKQFWAPDVTKVDGKWMLYLTCYNAAEDSRIAAFTSAGPAGPFSLVGVLTDSRDTGILDTIDPEVVTDPKSGRTWLFFGSIGRIHRVELNRAGTALKNPGNPVYTHVAGVLAEDNPERDKVFEGTYIHWHKGYWYLFASGGHYWNHTYRIVAGRSRTLDGVFVDEDGKPMTEGFATTILSSEEGDRFYGPGHNGEIFRDRKGNEYMLYHCHNTDNERSSVRNTLLQRINWRKDGWPCFEGGKPVQEDMTPRF